MMLTSIATNGSIAAVELVLSKDGGLLYLANSGSNVKIVHVEHEAGSTNRAPDKCVYSALNGDPA